MMNKNNNIVNLEKIKDLRKAKGLTREEMAKILNLNSPYTLRNRELGTKEFTIKELHTLAKLFNLPMEDLLIITKEAK